MSIGLKEKKVKQIVVRTGFAFSVLWGRVLDCRQRETLRTEPVSDSNSQRRSGSIPGIQLIFHSHRCDIRPCLPKPQPRIMALPRGTDRGTRDLT